MTADGTLTALFICAGMLEMALGFYVVGTRAARRVDDLKIGCCPE